MSFESRYNIGETLGRGAFSTVHLVHPKQQQVQQQQQLQNSTPSPKTSPLNPNLVVPAASKTESAFLNQFTNHQQQAASLNSNDSCNNNNNNNVLASNPSSPTTGAFAAKIFFPQKAPQQQQQQNATSMSSKTTPNVSPARSFNAASGGGVSPARLFGMEEMVFSNSNSGMYQAASSSNNNMMMTMKHQKSAASASSTPTTPREQTSKLPQNEDVPDKEEENNHNQQQQNFAFDQAAAEASILASCPIHPSLLHLHETFLDESTEKNPVIITELAPGRELFQILAERQRTRNQTAAPFSEGEVRSIMSQLFSAIAALHNADIVHRDCKLENLMWDQQQHQHKSAHHHHNHHHHSFHALTAGSRPTSTSTSRLTLVDFGMAVRLNHPGERLSTLCAGSPHYVSPEMLRTAKYANNSSQSTPIQGPAVSPNVSMSPNFSPSPNQKMPPPQLPFNAAVQLPTKTFTTPPPPPASGGGAVRNNSLTNFHLGSSPAAATSPTTGISATSPTAIPQLLPSRNLNSVTNYGKEIDVWACGVIMYVLIEGQYPFHNEKNKLAWHRSVFEGSYRPPQAASDSAKNLIRKLLEVDPKKRITASEALRDEFFFCVGAEEGEGAFGAEDEDMMHNNKKEDKNNNPLLTHEYAICVNGKQITTSLKKDYEPSISQTSVAGVQLHDGDLLELGDSEEFNNKARLGVDYVFETNSVGQEIRVFTPQGARSRRIHGPKLFRVSICGRGLALRAHSPRRVAQAPDFVPAAPKIEREDDDEIIQMTEEERMFQLESRETFINEVMYRLRQEQLEQIRDEREESQQQQQAENSNDDSSVNSRLYNRLHVRKDFLALQDSSALARREDLQEQFDRLNRKAEQDLLPALQHSTASFWSQPDELNSTTNATTTIPVRSFLLNALFSICLVRDRIYKAQYNCELPFVPCTFLFSVAQNLIQRFISRMILNNEKEKKRKDDGLNIKEVLMRSQVHYNDINACRTLLKVVFAALSVALKVYDRPFMGYAFRIFLDWLYDRQFNKSVKYWSTISLGNENNLPQIDQQDKLPSTETIMPASFEKVFENYEKSGGHFIYFDEFSRSSNMWGRDKGINEAMFQFEADVFLAKGLDYKAEAYTVADAALILVRLCEIEEDDMKVNNNDNDILIKKEEDTSVQEDGASSSREQQHQQILPNYFLFGPDLIGALDVVPDLAERGMQLFHKNSSHNFINPKPLDLIRSKLCSIAWLYRKEYAATSCFGETESSEQTATTTKKNGTSNNNRAPRLRHLYKSNRRDRMIRYVASLLEFSNELSSRFSFKVQSAAIVSLVTHLSYQYRKKKVQTTCTTTSQVEIFEKGFERTAVMRVELEDGMTKIEFERDPLLLDANDMNLSEQEIIRRVCKTASILEENLIEQVEYVFTKLHRIYCVACTLPQLFELRASIRDGYKTPFVCLKSQPEMKVVINCTQLLEEAVHNHAASARKVFMARVEEILASRIRHNNNNTSNNSLLSPTVQATSATAHAEKIRICSSSSQDSSEFEDSEDASSSQDLTLAKSESKNNNNNKKKSSTAKRGTSLQKRATSVKSEDLLKNGGNNNNGNNSSNNNNLFQLFSDPELLPDPDEFHFEKTISFGSTPETHRQIQFHVHYKKFLVANVSEIVWLKFENDKSKKIVVDRFDGCDALFELEQKPHLVELFEKLFPENLFGENEPNTVDTLEFLQNWYCAAFPLVSSPGLSPVYPY